jgi:hypothetical protein
MKNIGTAYEEAMEELAQVLDRQFLAQVDEVIADSIAAPREGAVTGGHDVRRLEEEEELPVHREPAREPEVQ